MVCEDHALFFFISKIFCTFAFAILECNCVDNMETEKTLIEQMISTILDDIHQKGYSFILPFSIGKVEDRMMLFAKEHQITLASDELYMVVSGGLVPDITQKWKNMQLRNRQFRNYQHITLCQGTGK